MECCIRKLLVCLLGWKNHTRKVQFFRLARSDENILKCFALYIQKDSYTILANESDRGISQHYGWNHDIS